MSIESIAEPARIMVDKSIRTPLKIESASPEAAGLGSVDQPMKSLLIYFTYSKVSLTLAPLQWQRWRTPGSSDRRSALRSQGRWCTGIEDIMMVSRHCQNLYFYKDYWILANICLRKSPTNTGVSAGLVGSLLISGNQELLTEGECEGDGLGTI